MNPEKDEPDIVLKIVVVGESGVGKSNIVTRYVNDTFNANSMSTIGVDLLSRRLLIDNVNLLIQLWDTAGQERMRALSSSFYKNAKGVMLIYDITSKESFARLKFWLKELRKSTDEKVKVTVVGNKTDLLAQREVSEEEAKLFAGERGFYYMEVSAKTNEGGCVNLAVETLVREIIREMKKEDFDSLKKEAELKLSTLKEVQTARMIVGDKKGCC